VEWVRQTASGLTELGDLHGRRAVAASRLSGDALGKALKERGFRILLETEGGLPEALRKVLPVVDAIAADIKLPSTTGEPLNWQATETFFLLIAQSGKEACAKVVITPDIDESEFQKAVTMLAQLHAEHRQTLPLILQPVTPARFVTEPPSLALLLRLLALARSHLPDVRIVPQVHKFVNLA
jgi:7-carboxy-7-deazaguanine synthase